MIDKHLNLELPFPFCTYQHVPSLHPCCSALPSLEWVPPLMRTTFVGLSLSSPPSMPKGNTKSPLKIAEENLGMNESPVIRTLVQKKKRSDNTFHMQKTERGDSQWMGCCRRQYIRRVTNENSLYSASHSFLLNDSLSP